MINIIYFIAMVVAVMIGRLIWEVLFQKRLLKFLDRNKKGKREKR